MPQKPNTYAGRRRTDGEWSTGGLAVVRDHGSAERSSVGAIEGVVVPQAEAGAAHRAPPGARARGASPTRSTRHRPVLRAVRLRLYDHTNRDQRKTGRRLDLRMRERVHPAGGPGIVRPRPALSSVTVSDCDTSLRPRAATGGSSSTSLSRCR